jgi:hypothetical protein
MQPCNIIQSHNYKNFSRIYATFKRKKDAMEYLEMIKKTSKNLYSKCVFSAKTDILTCYHGNNNDVTFYKITPINK